MPVVFSPGEVSSYYATRLPKLRQGPGWEWRYPCPIHGGKRDSFAVERESGRWYCHSQCGKGGDIIDLEQALVGVDFATAKMDVFSIVGRSEPTANQYTARRNGDSSRAGASPFQKSVASAVDWREIECYPYADEAGNLLFEVVRRERGEGAEREKDFRQRRPDGHGGWIWNLEGVRRVPYRLPKLLDADMVFLAEGEKDVQTLEDWGLVASCNPGGAGKGRPEWSDHFAEKHIVILTDNDEPGRKHAAMVAAAHLGTAASVRVVEFPCLADKGDVTDWREAGGTLTEFQKLINAATLLDPAQLRELRARWGIREIDEPDVKASANWDEWPDPLPLQNELPPVEPFCEDLLPASLRPLALDVAERMQVPMDFPAIVLVLCLAGVVNRRAAIQPKANDSGWLVVPNLWGGIVAPPGLMKSPVIQAATRPLNQIETDWRLEHEEDLSRYVLAKEKHELRLAAWKEQFKANTKKGNAAPERPDDELTEPTLRRLIVNDATFEALHETMNENPAGVFVVRDELTGWWSTLDKPGREGERAFCLQAWNGDTGHTIDRIGRGTVHVPHCCMSMLGGIQPARLRSYLVDALHDGPSNDGLIQRFQLLVWPDSPPGWDYVDRAPDATSEQRAASVFRKLVELDPATALRFRFSPDAQLLFMAWLAELEAKVRGGELHSALVSHLSKYRSLMPSLALLFELADLASSDGFDGSYLLSSQNFASLEHTRQAAAFCDYLESHSGRIYSCVTTPQMRAAQELADKIKKRRIGTDGFFSCREVYLKGWSGLDRPEAVKLAVEVLEDAGWIREATSEPGPFGGRPSNRYAVNPKL